MYISSSFDSGNKHFSAVYLDSCICIVHSFRLLTRFFYRPHTGMVVSLEVSYTKINLSYRKASNAAVLQTVVCFFFPQNIYIKRKRKLFKVELYIASYPFHD